MKNKQTDELYEAWDDVDWTYHIGRLCRVLAAILLTIGFVSYGLASAWEYLRKPANSLTFALVVLLVLTVFGFVWAIKYIKNR